jgi:hypothetical protein
MGFCKTARQHHALRHLVLSVDSVLALSQASVVSLHVQMMVQVKYRVYFDGSEGVQAVEIDLTTSQAPPGLVTSVLTCVSR